MNMMIKNLATLAPKLNSVVFGGLLKVSFVFPYQKWFWLVRTQPEERERWYSSKMAPKKQSKKAAAKIAAPQKDKKRSKNEKPDEKSPVKKQKVEAAASSAAKGSPKSKGSSPSLPKTKAHDVTETYNLKLSSWNINGIRAWFEKKGLDFLHEEKPDVLCIQETKCSEDKLPSDLKSVDGYHCYWAVGEKAGYAGVGLLSKVKPIKVTYGIGLKEHDQEGRVITAEYDKFYLITAYVPNSGRGLVRLDYRMEWDKDFFAYLKKLSQKKEVILCGDLNVAHQEIDIANPSSNRRNAGFTKEERDSFGTLLEDGFIDTFRYLYPDVKQVYSFWTFMRNARANNVGWRLDYFVCSEGLSDCIHDSLIHTEVMGSDHCPVSLLLEM